MLVNALPLFLLVAVLLYLDQYQTGLLQAEVLVLREEAKIYAGALGESAVRLTATESPRIDPDIAVPLLRRLTEPTPDAQAKLYGPDGSLIADSRVRAGPSGAASWWARSAGSTTGSFPCCRIRRRPRWWWT
jgi:two-component system, OmpR family, sensor histidine kinase ChvG